MAKLIQMSHIRKTYDGTRNVLVNIDFSIGAGEISTIVGASGCGKSTFLNIVGLLDNFSDGEYIFDGVNIKRTKLNSYYRHRAMDIGFVFQAYCLIESLSVEENILMPFLYSDLHIDKIVLNRLDLVLNRLNISRLKDRKAALLSGGERQRVAIARAIIKSPKLVIADEPTGNLDEANAQLVIDAFQDISQYGTAIIIVTHNKHLSFGANSTYILDRGVLMPC